VKLPSWLSMPSESHRPRRASQNHDIVPEAHP
jgi:hypothetical protein